MSLLEVMCDIAWALMPAGFAIPPTCMPHNSSLSSLKDADWYGCLALSVHAVLGPRWYIRHPCSPCRLRSVIGLLLSATHDCKLGPKGWHFSPPSKPPPHCRRSHAAAGRAS
jgi:hypothetical protein